MHKNSNRTEMSKFEITTALNSDLIFCPFSNNITILYIQAHTIYLYLAPDMRKVASTAFKIIIAKSDEPNHC